MNIQNIFNVIITTIMIIMGYQLHIHEMKISNSEFINQIRHEECKRQVHAFWMALIRS